MRERASGWRAEVYRGPHFSIWFVLFGLLLMLAVATWFVGSTAAGNSPVPATPSAEEPLDVPPGHESPAAEPSQQTPPRRW
jgi:hypothetical protein